MAMMIPQISKKQTGWRFFLQTVLGRSYPRTVGQMRDVSWLFFDVLLPMLSVSAYVFVYRAIQAPEDYVGFVVVGGAMTAFWTNVLWSMSTQLYWEKEQGNLPLYIISPASLMAILLGMALGGLVSTTLHAVVIILLGSLLFHVNYVLVSLPELLAVFFLCMTALYGLGMMTASIFLMFFSAKPGTGPTWPRSRSIWRPDSISPSGASPSGSRPSHPSSPSR